MSNPTLAKKAMGFLGRARTRFTNFVYYKILSNKKSLLMIGGDDYPEFRNSIIARYSSNWKIASLSSTPSKTDLHIPLVQLTSEEYNSIQPQVAQFTKLFDSIIVLPSKIHHLSLKDEDIFSHFNGSRYNKTQQSLLAYKFASKMLTPNGVFILTGSQKAFFGDKQATTVNSIQTGQSSCLNTIVGERDYTDVNSCSLLVLTDDIDLENQELNKQIIELIKSWSEGSQLPYPGSFAKIVNKKSIYYPEFF